MNLDFWQPTPPVWRRLTAPLVVLVGLAAGSLQAAVGRIWVAKGVRRSLSAS
jgi:hypothetical protein